MDALTLSLFLLRVMWVESCPGVFQYSILVFFPHFSPLLTLRSVCSICVICKFILLTAFFLDLEITPLWVSVCLAMLDLPSLSHAMGEMTTTTTTIFPSRCMVFLFVSHESRTTFRMCVVCVCMSIPLNRWIEFIDITKRINQYVIRSHSVGGGHIVIYSGYCDERRTPDGDDDDNDAKGNTQHTRTHTYKNAKRGKKANMCRRTYVYYVQRRPPPTKYRTKAKLKLLPSAMIIQLIVYGM